MNKNFLAVCFPAILMLTGCGTFPGWLPTSGASRQQVQEQQSGRVEGIQVVDVNDMLARKLAESKRLGQFSDTFTSKVANNYVIGPGDVIEVTVWEAPPALLFSTMSPVSPSSSSSASNSVTLPAQMVAADGTISIPFAGRLDLRRGPSAHFDAAREGNGDRAIGGHHLRR
jgi:polysaccharide export outer membrane protein